MWGARVGFLSVADGFPWMGFAVWPERRSRGWRGRLGETPALSPVHSSYLKPPKGFPSQQPER